ncbi:MAG: universal stress protein [Syntrophobacterales bacterium]|nr:universal stress protein [Syntrophobacterales bacterium]
MLPSIKNILYATDLSQNSAFAFRYAILLADASDAKITILYVLPDVDSAMEVPIITQMGEERYYKLRKEKSRETIEKIEKRLSDFSRGELKNGQGRKDRVASILIHEGDAADEILNTADKLNSDIIVLGAHGKGILTHTFPGTVPDKLLRRSRRPVLVVPIPGDASDIDL